MKYYLQERLTNQNIYFGFNSSESFSVFDGIAAFPKHACPYCPTEFLSIFMNHSLPQCSRLVNVLSSQVKLTCKREYNITTDPEDTENHATTS